MRAFNGLKSEGKKKRGSEYEFYLALLPTLKEQTELGGGGMSGWRLERPCGLTLSLVSICARFLWTILTMPGGWIQASPSTCTGTPSSPRMVIFTWRHWNVTERNTGAVTQEGHFFFPFCFCYKKHRMLFCTQVLCSTSVFWRNPL